MKDHLDPSPGWHREPPHNLMHFCKEGLVCPNDQPDLSVSASLLVKDKTHTKGIKFCGRDTIPSFPICS